MRRQKSVPGASLYNYTESVSKLKLDKKTNVKEINYVHLVLLAIKVNICYLKNKLNLDQVGVVLKSVLKCPSYRSDLKCLKNGLRSRFLRRFRQDLACSLLYLKNELDATENVSRTGFWKAHSNVSGKWHEPS